MVLLYAVSHAIAFQNIARRRYMGGGVFISNSLKGSVLKSYHTNQNSQNIADDTDYIFVEYVSLVVASTICDKDVQLVPIQLPLHLISDWLNRDELRNMASLHNIRFLARDRKPTLKSYFKDHKCDVCDQYLCLFRPHVVIRKRDIAKQTTASIIHSSQKFPPIPPCPAHIEQIINDFCADTAPAAIQESGCCVCGQLKPCLELTPMKDCDLDLSCLTGDGITRKERRFSSDPVQQCQGPVLDSSCRDICLSCSTSIKKDRIPKHALANGLWLGKVPDQLIDLTFSEQMMIARVRHNRAVVRVSSGRAKMVANVIMFSNPTLAVYHMLPPSRDEMKEVLAFIFTGSIQPTDEDYKRTPFLVRRDKVSLALDWLKLNHIDYKDLEISRANLESYPLSGVPVMVDYKKTVLGASNKLPSATSIHDMEEEEGTSEGPCPFTVHGLTGDEFTKLSMTALKARALKHLEDQGKILGIGHEEKPQSIYDNPQAYPQMFPWLFPYGYGGIGQDRLKKKMSEAEQKRHLLMYHDKRFQRDLYFPIVAFNHEQLKAGITGSFLLAKRQKFNEISQRLLSLNKSVLSDLVKRLTAGEHVSALTEDQKACFAVLDDLDHVGGHVKGSLTNKKYMRHEVWSLISFLGAPSWFITLSPADNKHPICLYFADTNQKFIPDLKSATVRNHLVSSNPVAAARFFDLMVRSFLKNVLGVDHKHPGLYGNTSGYYGTVEQQGRLTLHLHLLLWISGALSPQDIRDRLVSKDSVFQQELIEYLEGLHQGEFLTGSIDTVRASVPNQSESMAGIHTVMRQPHPTHVLPSVSEYQNPTQTLPKPAPSRCKSETACDCSKCELNRAWWNDYYTTVDDLVLKSNVHRCTSSNSALDPSQSQKKTPHDRSISKTISQGPKGCLDRNGICRARFPRDIHETTQVDEADGHIIMKKLEASLNTFTPCLTYLMRCNTDVTSLSSGTSIKAIVSYITDYVTKPALKTHQIFSSMYDVFEKNDIQLGPHVKAESDASRRLILKMVNSLNAKMEIGSPMASMYLLGNPDHYTGHQFVCFWWKSYVTHIQQSADNETAILKADQAGVKSERVRIGQQNGVYVATTNVDDYKHRPDIYQNTSLYEWIQCSQKRRANKKEMAGMQHLNSNKETKATYHAFKEDHPLRASHVVRCDFERLTYIVPNIVGGALPRHDAGDREYYCCTMLTLFCPWRNSLSVKPASDSWETAFNVYEFSTKHRQLMRNFNLRYECLDARDDFHAQLIAKSRPRTQWHNSGDSEAETDVDFIKMPPTGHIEHGVIGRTYRSALKMMDSISSVLTNAGWLDPLLAPPTDTYPRLYPEHVPGAHWSNLIKNKCIFMFKEKFAHYVPPLEEENRPEQGKTSEKLVTLLGSEYFKRDFKAEKQEANQLIDDTVASFSLNQEQERALRIIANHISGPVTQQLRMYLGGMGGTGKSQVIKAVVYLLDQRKEGHRFVVLAPTGTAAALLNGSTYHKALGIHRKSNVGQDFSKNESAILNEVRFRLQGVEYIFLDEVSMIACHELYLISARLAQVTGAHDAPFGGMNIILAGDFAQLAPVFGSSLYDNNIQKYLNTRMSVRDQEATIGKVLWHQITTVVILTQNMRQKTQTESDSKLCKALENMRYAACTTEDLTFLKSLIAKNNKESRALSDSRFRNVSIITARNNQRDRINEEGCQRFAADHGLELTHFYSLDELAGSSNANITQKRRKRCRNTRAPAISGLIQADQEALWACAPYTSEHVASRLSLCIGMPVMVRSNEATELCVTKGQEAMVVGWDSFNGPYDHQVLETLFILLLNPPKIIQIPDLPTNVIPLTKTTTNIQCKTKSDQILQIKRQQVPVLPNFAMTDYASQGKTREYNVVDLGYSRDHLSYYTALSRSSSAAGTVLIQDFMDHKITCGISGWLRQEFRELNILNEITHLQYESKLPDHIVGPLRNPTIRAYHIFTKDKQVDNGWHPAIQYKSGEVKLNTIECDATWNIDMLNALRKSDRNPNPDAVLKRTATVVETCPGPAAKASRTEDIFNVSDPQGLIWDNIDYSCAYDSLFTILYNIWGDSPITWSRRFANISPFLKLLSEQFQLVKRKSMTLEQARDVVRGQLNSLDPIEYPMGSKFTCLAALAAVLMSNGQDHVSGTNYLQCRLCGSKGKNLLNVSEYFQLNSIDSFFSVGHEVTWISDYLGWHLSEQQKISQYPCLNCSTGPDFYFPLSLNVSMTRLPYVMCIMLNDSSLQIDHQLRYFYNDVHINFELRGIVYGDGQHFVARLVSTDGCIWFHDGIATGSHCVFQGNMDQIPDSAWLKTSSRGYDRRVALLAVYARD